MAKKQAAAIGDLEKRLKRREFDPVYLLYGEETFLVDRAVDLILERALDPATRSFNADVVYGGATAGADVLALATSFPMMADHRVVVVREFEKLAEKERLEPYLSDPLPSTILVLVTAKPDFRMKIFKSLEQHAASLEFRHLQDEEIADWITAKAKQQGKTIAPEASRLLQSYIGSSLRDAANELEKVSLFAGDRAALTESDVKAVVALSRDFSVFDLQRAIGLGDLPQAQMVLSAMLSSGENALGIIVMLTRFFQKVLLVHAVRGPRGSEYQLASRLRLSPAHVREYLQAASRFPPARLERCFRALLEADEQMKTSTGGTPFTVMDGMLYRFFADFAQN